MREKNPNLILSDEPVIYMGEKYYQVICIKRYRDYYAKRDIEVGEKGGLIHEKSIDGEPTRWLEAKYIVGAPVIETGTIQKAYIEYNYSSISKYHDFFKEAIKFWRLICGTTTPSEINAVMWHSSMNLDIVKQIEDEEFKLVNQHNMISEFTSRFFWILLGMIMESVVKIHIVIFREQTLNLKSDKLWKKKTLNIIKELFAMNHISNEELHFLEKINNSRNLVHFLDHEHVLPYDEYIYSVSDLLELMYKLLKKQKSYVSV
jgi:hypothetical protein